ncbi:MAG: M28 family peptidase [Saprospiraceae bacterium]|nr:M28 family peptidase [Saprospiraceae bacterium]
MLRYGLLYILSLKICLVWGQFKLETDPFAASFFARNITKEELKEDLTELSSDAFEGRETGSSGQEKAAVFLINRLRQLGAENPCGSTEYYQNIIFSYTRWENLSVVVNNKSYHHLRDFVCYQEENQNLPMFKANEVIYMGYGIDDPKYTDYKSDNVQGKIIMINPGEPFDKDSISLISNSHSPSDWNDNISRKLEVAGEHKVRMVLVIDPKIRERVSKNRGQIVGQKLQFGQIPVPKTPNTIYISPELAKDIIGSEEETFKQNRERIEETGVGRPVHLPVEIVIQQHLTRNVLFSKNIMGVIPGTDPALKDEFVVVSAHYDHLGKKGNSVFHGADDNGSGTAAVLEIMETLQETKKQGIGPKRSVLCIFFTAEEKGLLGSKYYSDHPVIPLEKTVADINIDMIGRIDPEHATNEQYVYVIGSDRLSSELHLINESINNTYSNLDLDYTYNKKTDPNLFYYRSDHYNFAKHGIPSVFFFSGVHEDYHKPTDTVDKILFDKYEQITKHIFYLTLELANRKNRIKVDVKDDTIYNR